MPEDSPGSNPEKHETSEERFRKIREELQNLQLPELSDDLLESVQKVESKAVFPDIPELNAEKLTRWSAKERFDQKKIETSRRHQSEQKISRGVGLGLVAAYAIIGLPMVGIGIGWLVDKFTRSNAFVGIGAMVGAVLGLVIAVRMLNQSNQS